MLSTHAASRCAGRAIPLGVIELLETYGREVRSGGCSKYFLDKQCRKRLAREVGSTALKQYGRKLDTYAVVADTGVVVTAAYRTRRIKHK